MGGRGQVPNDEIALLLSSCAGFELHIQICQIRTTKYGKLRVCILGSDKQAVTCGHTLNATLLFIPEAAGLSTPCISDGTKGPLQLSMLLTFIGI